ncbi:Uncharacterised protein [Ectopseudomonas mendocina]|uniref:Uncharacterized protein n=1 Tax=Ectopseudomonas mendocina TaxID=300 RepID=A0A379PPK4_ECTME|nr:hypothetical protein [Pseudomonas mendocina]SUE95758.1 Uncharacterised protein [Pseudomonas mendocina]
MLTMRYLNRPAVDDYLTHDSDVQSVLEIDHDRLYERMERRSLQPWSLYLCPSIKLNLDHQDPTLDVPESNNPAAAYILCGDERTFIEISLYWNDWHEQWIVRVIESRDGEITLDTEDSRRYGLFDKAWSSFCNSASETEATEYMKALYTKQKPAAQQPNKPMAYTIPRPSIFGTWS